MPEHATADQLRHDIDSGRTRDKVCAPDPTVAPLGTDEEAAGYPPPPEAIALARRLENRRIPDPVRSRGAAAAAWLLIGISAATLAAVIIALGEFPRP